MWKKIKWGLAILALLVTGLFLHYTLPQRDVVQVINTCLLYTSPSPRDRG